MPKLKIAVIFKIPLYERKAHLDIFVFVGRLKTT